ncbi:hypothetical protein CHCC14820_3579 [Bacillus paralicheniformis]|uniref:Uncharacterized protein n=1 Tax=Bacillus paralicheniformis TaxID=1648923 RepID=A0A6N2ESS8_9BACI|nr:hypothetical protein SC10_B2orf04339 [Bacillus paralicheniformis]OLF91312.1 hypothetical protein B4121_2790 [Bacillus paralicheniformis]OLF99803.1 hypothetical protein B4125_4481 [Bacillus paralicheniformis]OLG13014.1 hypothetical protein B4123_0436 [Bacillus paralicheniformis]TWJ42426.1 hypothetical protein CHCC5027_4246 [Bacillus paralicheniformis]
MFNPFFLTAEKGLFGYGNTAASSLKDGSSLYSESQADRL